MDSPRSSSCSASTSIPFVPLDVEELTDRVLRGAGPGARGDDDPPAGRRGMSEWHRQGMTLTVLDPLRLEPPFLSRSERRKSLFSVAESMLVLPAEAASACEEGLLSTATVSAPAARLVGVLVDAWGVTSLAQAAMCDADAVKAIQKSKKHDDLSVPDRSHLHSLVSSLNNRRPLEPIYSIKRLMHQRSKKKGSKKNASVGWLDLASHEMKQDEDEEEEEGCRRALEDPAALRQIYSDAAEVQEKLILCTFSPNRRGRDDSSPRPKTRTDVPIRKIDAKPDIVRPASADANLNFNAHQGGGASNWSISKFCLECGGPKGKAGAGKKFCPKCWNYHKYLRGKSSPPLAPPAHSASPLMSLPVPTPAPPHTRPPPGASFAAAGKPRSVHSEHSSDEGYWSCSLQSSTSSASSSPVESFFAEMTLGGKEEKAAKADSSSVFVGCPNLVFGCEFQGIVTKVDTHASRNCAFVPTCCCPFLGCRTQGSIKFILAHLSCHAVTRDVDNKDAENASPIRTNALASLQADISVSIPKAMLFGGGGGAGDEPAPANDEWFPFRWYPRQFVLDGVTFIQMMYRRSSPDESQPLVRFYFWIWALDTPEVADNFYYTLTLTRGSNKNAEDEGSTSPQQQQQPPVKRYHAMTKSIQISRDSIERDSAARHRPSSSSTSGNRLRGRASDGPRLPPLGAVVLDQDQIRRCVEANQGRLRYNISIVKP